MTRKQALEVVRVWEEKSKGERVVEFIIAGPAAVGDLYRAARALAGNELRRDLKKEEAQANG